MAKATNAKQVRRSGVQVMLKLIGLVRPLLPVMVLAVLLGVTGFLCAIFLNVFGAEALASAQEARDSCPVSAISIEE